jgi:hypothetical protein
MARVKRREMTMLYQPQKAPQALRADHRVVLAHDHHHADTVRV